VNGQDVDHASLAVDSERHLLCLDPVGHAREELRDRLVKGRIVLTDQTIKLLAAPPEPDVELSVHCVGDSFKRIERDSLQASVLELDDRPA
jgi:hypothetical protein